MEVMDTSLIALCGPQQVGKTTAAKSLAKHHGYKRVSFADPLYEMVAALLNISTKKLRSMDKEKPLGALNGRSIRHSLQTLGTEWGREHMDHNLWRDTCIARVQKYIDKGHRVVVDDCRFTNEYEALAGIGAKIIRLHRSEDGPAQSSPDHGSEKDWTSFKVDAVVENRSGTPSGWDEFAGTKILAAIKTPAKAAS